MRASDRERAYAMSITETEMLVRRALAVWAFVTAVGLLAWIDRVLWGPW